MNMRYIVDKDTGKFLYYGRDRNDLVDAGHIEVPALTAKPDGEFYIWDGTEWVEDTTAKTKADNKIKLEQTDMKMARITEDLIDFLGNITSLPQSAQNLIAERKRLRSNI